MCGISIYFRKEKSNILKQLVQMNDIISHRGPDDEGFVLFDTESEQINILGGKNTPDSMVQSSIRYTPNKKVNNQDFLSEKYNLGFAHRRLSIIDLTDAGHQPMSDNTGKYWISYNGEIYNYRELKDELRKSNFFFYSNSDTEVIINAYKKWGIECLSKFNGMFAFVIYDRTKNIFFAARDRYGVKPLYYRKTVDGILSFASEIKQFTVLDDWKAVLNLQAAYDFLNWGLTNHEEETFFDGVNRLMPGHYLTYEIRSEKVKIEPWYTLPQKTIKRDFDNAVSQFQKLFKDSVALRLRSDVPVGSCLSGGLDSSAIVCIIHALRSGNNERQLTFSACSKYPEFDEKEYIDEVVKKTNVDAHFIYPELNDLLNELDNVIWHQDEPFGTTSIFAQWKVFQLSSKNKIKVMLDGQGADEILGGYYNYYIKNFVDLIKRFSFRRLFIEIMAAKKYQRINSAIRSILNEILPFWMRSFMRKIFKTPVKKVEWIDLKNKKIKLFDPHYYQTYGTTSFYRFSFLQISKINLPQLLHFEDRNSMAHSIEARTPFLDYRLLEYTLSLQNSYKIKNGITKKILRESLKNILPLKIYNRTSKLGFATPEAKWVIEENPKLFKKLVKESISLTNGFLNDKAEKKAYEIIDGKVTYNSFVWRVIVFGLWIKRFSVSIVR
ncbi:MAG: asparagine synthase (glutamine-hydrolyzing) [Spirochaetia bacterium]|nr:asparagine synthase (glutamine-hydrolyzing) [Spirochaetia bacterium]